MLKMLINLQNWRAVAFGNSSYFVYLSIFGHRSSNCFLSRSSGHPFVFSVEHPVIRSSNLASQSSIRSSDLASPMNFPPCEQTAKLPFIYYYFLPQSGSCALFLPQTCFVSLISSQSGFCYFYYEMRDWCKRSTGKCSQEIVYCWNTEPRNIWFVFQWE